MIDKHTEVIATELHLKNHQVANTIKLLGEDSTVPFIARYRKEMTGSLDEVAVATIRDRLQQLTELEKRRDAILKSLEERELLTDELKCNIQAASAMAELEDIYLPFRPKRRTRATIAREMGLEPLAKAVFKQDGIVPERKAEQFLQLDGEEKLRVETVEDALSGARDIIAEWINENQGARSRIRKLFLEKGKISSKLATGDEEAAAKYRDYFDWSEPISTAPSHRILALFRGEREMHLRVKAAPPEAEALEILTSLFVKGSGADSEQVKAAAEDCYKRLLAPSMENEIRAWMKKRADEAAVKVFADNLRELLLASPLGEKRVLAIDPGYRTGCKVVCLDSQGKLLHNTSIFLTSSRQKSTEAESTVRDLCRKFEIEAIAIGNGTGSRETDAFIKDLDLDEKIIVEMVNESGASVYSASKMARMEFPDHDVTVRGAVSIGRRLMDPLAELVKIDPKSIGVGQYQHDIDQALLKEGLDDVVVSCVNSVGVDVNTASVQLLSYVSGLGPLLAKNIVTHRDESGPFKTRFNLNSVSRLGPKAFEQAAGFLRIRNGENPLDASAVHPESYPVVESMAADLNVSIGELMSNTSLRTGINLRNYATDTIGIPTLTDIIAELERPGRDPRKSFEAFSFAEGVNSISDLKSGMKLPGIVTNVTAFGAFVDIGVHQDGLVHISQLADSFVNNPHQVVKVGQRLEVTVMDVDQARKRISLSMRKDPFKKPENKESNLKTLSQKRNTSKPQRDRKHKQRSKQAPQKFGNNPFESLKNFGKKSE